MAQVQTRSILCPVCARGKLIKEADDGGASGVSTYPPTLHHRAKYFVKCPVCKSQIGISLKSPKI